MCRAPYISTYAGSIGLAQPLLGNFGMMSRDSHRANGQTTFYWNAYKNTAISDRVTLQSRCEVYNLFNHHTFQDVGRNISNPAFGQCMSPAQGQRFPQVGAVLKF